MTRTTIAFQNPNWKKWSQHYELLEKCPI